MVRTCVLLICAMTSASPAWADIYRWTDKDGNLNYSDSPPPGDQQARDVKVVTKSRPQPSGPSQQELLARIQNLEQQLQTQQSVAQPVVYAPPVMQPAYQPAPIVPAYVPPAPVAPPVAYYDAGYDNRIYDGLYSPPLTTWTFVPSYVITPARLHPIRHISGPRTPGRGPLNRPPPRVPGRPLAVR